MGTLTIRPSQELRARIAIASERAGVNPRRFMLEALLKRLRGLSAGQIFARRPRVDGRSLLELASAFLGKRFAAT